MKQDILKCQKTCKCKCRLDASVCNNKQRQKKDKCRCECKELIDKVYVIKDLFGVLLFVNANIINYVAMKIDYIQTMKIVNVEKTNR